MMIKYIKIFFVIFFFASCENRIQRDVSLPLVDSSVLKIDFNLKEENEKILILNKEIQINEIIPLQMTNGLYISDVSQCIIADSVLYILDEKFSKILSFNAKGEFLREIGKLGNKIGEFENISNFFIDSRKNINVFSSESMKILVFDKVGHFISEKKIPFYAAKMTNISDNKYAFYIDYNTSKFNGNCNLIITDSLLKIQEKFFKYPSNPEGITLSKVSGGIFQSSKESALYYGAFQDSIFEVNNSNNVVSLKYVINNSQDNVPEDIKADPSNLFMINADKMMDFGYLSGVIYETDSLLSFSWTENRRVRNAIFHKQSTMMKNTDFLGFSESYLGKTIGVTSDNFISSINIDTYKRNILDNYDAKKYLNKKYPDLSKKLDMMYNSQENPILIIWGCKSI